MRSSEEEKAKAAQEKLRANATPAQRNVLLAADAAFAEANSEFEARFDGEAKLRGWAKTLCGVNLDMSEIEDLQALCRKTKASSLMYFYPKRKSSGVLLYKTAFGTIDRAESYLSTLEKTVIDVTNNSQFTALPAFGLIKLGLKRLFKRRK